MDVWFRTRRLARLCGSDEQLRRKLGSTGARRLKQRLADLEAAHDAGVLLTLPGRWHPLKADRAGQMSGDLEHPVRIIIEPVESSGFRRSDGGFDWSLVTGVVVVEIADTHG